MGGPDQIGSAGRRPAERKVAGLIPGQGTCLGYGFGPGQGVYRRQPISVSLLSFSLPSPLKVNK